MGAYQYRKKKALTVSPYRQVEKITPLLTRVSG
jgi:hypothetical protein